MKSDDWKFNRRRDKLMDELREKGIKDERVLSAMAAVPRHLFVEHAFQHRAYEDVALPIGHRVTISQPYTVAIQTEMMAVKKDSRILEIGTGSGYQAAVLCEMGARVFTVERIKPLFDRTSALLRETGYRAVCRYGDGTQGWESVGPFDGIIVTAGAVQVPEPLMRQLRPRQGVKPGGRLIIPVGDRDGQRMYRFTRMDGDNWEEEAFDGFRFVPLLGDTEG